MPRLPTPVGSFGTITRVHLPDGTWQARTYVPDLDGERRQVARRGRSAAAAERALKSALAERTAPARSSLGPSTLVREVAERWFAGIQSEVDAGDKSPNTARLYRHRHYLDRHILPGVGALRLSEAGVARLDEFVTAVRARSGAGAAKACRSALSGIMGYAARHGAIPTNPVRDIGRLPGGRRGVKARSLTLAECRRWIAQLEADPVAVRRDLPDLTRWFLATGVRIGEAIAVDWTAIDGERAVVEIDLQDHPGQGRRPATDPPDEVRRRAPHAPATAVRDAHARTSARRLIGNRPTVPGRDRRLARPHEPVARASRGPRQR